MMKTHNQFYVRNFLLIRERNQSYTKKRYDRRLSTYFSHYKIVHYYLMTAIIKLDLLLFRTANINVQQRKIVSYAKSSIMIHQLMKNVSSVRICLKWSTMPEVFKKKKISRFSMTISLSFLLLFFFQRIKTTVYVNSMMNEINAVSSIRTIVKMIVSFCVFKERKVTSLSSHHH